MEADVLIVICAFSCSFISGCASKRAQQARTGLQTPRPSLTFHFPFSSRRRSWEGRRKVTGRTALASLLLSTGQDRRLSHTRAAVEAAGLLGFHGTLFILKEELNSCKESSLLFTPGTLSEQS